MTTIFTDITEKPLLYQLKRSNDSSRVKSSSWRTWLNKINPLGEKNTVNEGQCLDLRQELIKIVDYKMTNFVRFLVSTKIFTVIED